MPTQEIDITKRVDAKGLYVNTLEGSVSTASIDPGGFGGVGVVTTIVPPQLYLANLTFEIRVDTDDAAHQYPSGSSLTEEQFDSLLPTSWADSGTSGIANFTDDAAGVRTWIIHIENMFGTVPHVYHIHYKIYGLFAAYTSIAA